MTLKTSESPDTEKDNPGENPSEKKLREARRREGKTFSGKGMEVQK